MKRSSDWAGSGGAGKPGAASSGAASSGEAHRDKRAADEGAREKLEKAATVSSIKSKLSKPKVLSTDLNDARKKKLGTSSAGLTREQIVASQRQHREQMEARGKPVPHYSTPRG